MPSDFSLKKDVPLPQNPHKNTKHGNSYGRTYNIWAMMRQRCSNPRAQNYVNYGARGISVDPRWDKFALFLEDMGHPPTLTHTLDRINVLGNYTKQNCRWATAEEQQNNRRNAVVLTGFGKTMTMKQWSRELGIRYDVMQYRIRTMGLSLEEAATMPKGSCIQQPVVCYSLHEKKPIACWESLAAMEKATGLDKRTIHSCLVGRGKSAKGYFWAYVTQEEFSTLSTTLKNSLTFT